MLQALTIKTGGAKCSADPLDLDNLIKLSNEIFTGGCKSSNNNSVKFCWADTLRVKNNTRPVFDFITARCKEATADMVFMYLAAVCFIVSAIVLFLRKRKSV